MQCLLVAEESCTVRLPYLQLVIALVHVLLLGPPRVIQGVVVLGPPVKLDLLLVVRVRLQSGTGGNATYSVHTHAAHMCTCAHIVHICSIYTQECWFGEVTIFLPDQAKLTLHDRGIYMHMYMPPPCTVKTRRFDPY